MMREIIIIIVFGFEWYRVYRMMREIIIISFFCCEMVGGYIG